MKKIETTTITTYIGKTKLYLDDVEYVMSKLRSLDLNVEISDADNVYDSLEELRSIKGINLKLINFIGKPKDLSFGFILIRLSDQGSAVHVERSEKLLGIAYEIEKFLKTRRRKMIYAFFNSQNAKANIMVNIILALAIYFYSITQKLPFNYFVWVSIIMLWVFIFFLCELNSDCNSKIELDRKHNLKFYEKNKEKILLASIGAVIGAVITLLIGYLKGK